MASVGSVSSAVRSCDAAALTYKMPHVFEGYETAAACSPLSPLDGQGTPLARHASSLILPRLRSSPSSPSRHAQVQAAECTDHPTRRTPCNYALPCTGYVACGHGHSLATLSLGLYCRFRKDRTVYMMISYVFLSPFCLGRFRFRS